MISFLSVMLPVIVIAFVGAVFGAVALARQVSGWSRPAIVGFAATCFLFAVVCGFAAIGSLGASVPGSIGAAGGLVFGCSLGSFAILTLVSRRDAS